MPRRAGCTRYPQGGGLSAERQAFREHVRLQAAELFVLGEGNAAVAGRLRVSVRSVQRRRRAWEHGGERALASKGPMSGPRLSEALFRVLEQELARGRWRADGRTGGGRRHGSGL
ncbi:hypothetical protein GCM10010358_25270 [Streptomyces minutiscleroticus]|uniref:Transposase n=1 Tax=Streptomyces minutiscleroticus TaxID=68238 RepID=A0A918KPQ1_9ACTN|nr:hypothetical protein GCM10010358_25270 [Streptomyces minutiscleroticus]